MTKIVDDNLKRWTQIKLTQDYKTQPPIVVTVNDRAATRQAIIARVRQSGLEFVERSHWGAHKNRSEKMHDDWNYTMIAIHHAGRSSACGPAALQLQDIQDKQMKSSSEPKDDIAYHYAIDCMGNIYEGRDIRFKGEHLSQYNTGVVGIVMLENLTEPGEGVGFGSVVTKMFSSKPNIPEDQAISAKSLVLALKEFFYIQQLGGHREFPHQYKADKICPGNVGMELVSRLRHETGIAAP